MKKKVVSIVLNDFTHDSRVLKECVSLMNAGFEVRVAAMHSKGLAERENMNGLDVHRYPISSQKLSNGLFLSGVKYVQLLWKIYRDNQDANIYHCNDIEALPIGVIAKWMGRGKKVVYDAHEYESEKGGVYGFRKKLLFYFERFFIRYADQVITVGNSIAKEYASLFKIKTPSVVMNCPVLKEVNTSNLLLRKHFDITDDNLVLLLQGLLTDDRGIKEVIMAFEEQDRNDLSLIFMGHGEMVGYIREATERNSDIYYLPSVPPDKVIAYTSSADIGLIFTENSCLSHYYSMPNKFFEYIHARLAIIAWPLFEIKQIIEDANAGIVTNDFTYEDIADAFRSLRKEDIEKLRNNSATLKHKYNWGHQELVLEKVYKDLYN